MLWVLMISSEEKGFWFRLVTRRLLADCFTGTEIVIGWTGLVPCLHWGAPKWMIFLPFPFSYASIHLNVSWFHCFTRVLGVSATTLVHYHLTWETQAPQSQNPSRVLGLPGVISMSVKTPEVWSFAMPKRKSKIFGILEVPKLKESS